MSHSAVNPEIWKRLEAAFLTAASLDQPARAVFVAEISLRDPVLGARVSQLLAAENLDDALLIRPIFAEVWHLGRERQPPAKLN